MDEDFYQGECPTLQLEQTRLSSIELNHVRLCSRSTRVFQSRLSRMLLISLAKSLQKGSLSTLEQVMMCNVHWIKAVRKSFSGCAGNMQALVWY